MKKTTTIENVSTATLRTLQRLEEAIHTRHIIQCGKCGGSEEFNEGDSMDAASWFQMAGWKVRAGRVKCPQCALGSRIRYVIRSQKSKTAQKES